jgi:hypothetical protein
MLTDDQLNGLKSDVMRLLDGQCYPKSFTQIKAELVRFLGWNYHQIYGPRTFVWDCLDDLVAEGLANCRLEGAENFPQSRVIHFYWRTSKETEEAPCI